jgi:hypothetical protein
LEAALTTLTIPFASAPAGAGKTHQAAKRAKDWARQGHIALLVSPTKELCDRTNSQEFRTDPKCPPTYVFHAGTVGAGNVVKALLNHFEKPPAQGHIVQITHASLPLVPRWKNQSNIGAIVDEEMAVIRHMTHRIPETHSFLTDLIKLDPYDAVYGRVQVIDPIRLEELARNEQSDELIAHIQESAWILLNQHYDTFINLEQFHKLRKGQTHTLNFHSILLPSVVQGFGSVFMAAANFEDTLIHAIWSERGVHFKPDSGFAKSLRYSSHENGHRLDIYFFTERHWSKRFADQRLDNDRTVLDAIIEKVHDLLGNGKFLIQANKGRSLPPNSNATRLPNKPHGLNSYTKFHDIACLAATNLRPDDSRFMESLGLNRDQVRQSIYLHGTYQSVARTSLRSHDDDSPKRVIVPDRCAAEYIASLFPGSRIHKIDIGLSAFELAAQRPGRPKQYNSCAERNRASRARAREKKAEVLMGQIALQRQQKGNLDNSGINPEDILIKEINSNDLQNASLAGTLYESERATLPLGYVKWTGEDDLLSFLSEASNRQLEGKGKNFLFSPAVFDPSLGGGYRKKNNIRFLRHIWLDFEDGDLTPDELAALFPTVKMLITNSYRHTKEKPRYRALMFTDAPMTVEAQGVVIESIASKLRDAGYWVNKRRRDVPCPKHLKRSGLDWSKRVATSLFYLPCQAADPSQSFFTAYDDEHRQPINVERWIQNSALKVDAERPVVGLKKRRPVDQAAVQIAIDLWRQSPSFPQEGNDRFFTFARSLKSAGMTISEIETVLNEEYQYARSPEERRRQIPSIMISLIWKLE